MVNFTTESSAHTENVNVVDAEALQSLFDDTPRGAVVAHLPADERRLCAKLAGDIRSELLCAGFGPF